MRPALTGKDFEEGKKTMPHTARRFGWFYFQKENISIGLALKCGTASIKQFVWMNEAADNITSIEPREITGDAYFVVRHPLDRFCSLWKSKCRDNQSSAYKETLADMSPVELMDHIEAGARDPHWTPQGKVLNWCSQDVKLIPLEMLGFWWKQSKLGKLEKFNVTDGEVDIDDELKARILIYYAADLKLYHKAQCDFCWDTLISH